MNTTTRTTGAMNPTLMAMLAGLIVTLGLPPVPNTGWLVPMGLAVLFVALHEAPGPGRTLWVFGFAHQASLLHWLFLLIPAKSIPTRALVPVQAILAILYVTSFYLLLGWLWGKLRERTGRFPALLVLPVLWTGMEAMRAHGEMAFPWCLTGCAVLGGPLMPWLRASGEIGLCALMAFLGMTGALIWIWWRQGSREAKVAVFWAGGGSIVLVLGLMVGASFRPENLRATPLRVAAVQANVSLEDKWQDAKIDSTRLPYAHLTKQAAVDGAELVVWAETAVPAYIRHENEHLRWLKGVITEAGAALYAGFPDAERLPDGTLNKYNSSGLFNARGQLRGRYPKHHLLPIGEAMPFTSLIPALAKIDVGQAEWTPGPVPQPLILETAAGHFPFSGLICFESILSAQARDSVRRGSRCLMVLTNDGWFGRTAGPRQHTALALLRAVESDVPVIRCANNGISFLADGQGRILQKLDLGQRGYIVADIEPGTGATAYVRWGAWPLFGFLCAFFLLALSIGRRSL